MARCVRALGMPGFTDAGVSSAPLYRDRDTEGIGDHVVVWLYTRP